jgi:hypothetical protein
MITASTNHIQEKLTMATQAQFDLINNRLTALTVTISTVIASQAATIAQLREQVLAGGLTADQESAILANLDSLANNLQTIASSASAA